MNDNLMSITPAHTSVVQKSVENRTADDNASLAEVSEQYKAIFVNELLKAARAEKLFDDALDIAGSAHFLEMMDHDISKTVS